MKIMVAQINPTVGDLEGNLLKLIAAHRQGASLGVDLVVTPELSLVGYPPRDLLDRVDFIRAIANAHDRLLQNIAGPALIFGSVREAENTLDPHEKPVLLNALCLVEDGAMLACHHKILLPSYDVFDEGRYFQTGSQLELVTYKNNRIALSICEDIWTADATDPLARYSRNPLEDAVAGEADLLINISASPFDSVKPAARATLLSHIVKQYDLPVLYVNQVGGNDALVFDGASLAIDGGGRIHEVGARFKGSMDVVDFDVSAASFFTDCPERRGSGFERRRDVDRGGVFGFARLCREMWL